MDKEYAKAVAEYRALLTTTEQESQADFDKTVLALSGGSLGLSFAFTKDVVGPGNMVHTPWLFCAWIGWGLSSAAVLISFYFSQRALRTAIYQLDAGKLSEERAGGWYDRMTNALNLAGLLLFLSGLTTMLIFLNFNLRDHMNKPDADNMQSDFAGRLVPPPPAEITKSSASGSPVATPQTGQTAPPAAQSPTPSTNETTK